MRRREEGWGDATVVDFALVRSSLSTTGRVFDILSQAGLGSISISGDDVFGLSDSQGIFSVVAATDDSEPRSATFAGPGIVARQTQIRVPGPDAAVSLIPSGFDLGAFDQMVRTPRLRRWVQAPPLRIERRTLIFTSTNAAFATAEADTMTDDEQADLVTTLTAALSTFSAGAFSGFASTISAASPEGASVPVLNTGVITVARLSGLTAGTGFWGYSRWQFAADGTIVAGLMMLDRDFERSASPYRTTLRLHEFGHAMGYDHVTSQTSVMNSSGRILPTAFDLDAFRIAFQRRPGNVSPDTDSGSSVNVLSSPLTWSSPRR